MPSPTEKRAGSSIHVPAIFGISAASQISLRSRLSAVGALVCLAVSVVLWAGMIAAGREARALDQFALSRVRQDSVLRAFARSEDFSSGLLSFRESPSQGSEQSPLMPLRSHGRNDRASDLLGSLEQAQASSLSLTWIAHVKNRVLDEGASVPLMVVFRHESPQTIDEPLRVPVAINYDPAEFALSPQQPSKEVVLQAGQRIGSTSWILRPLKTGDHSIAIEALGDVQALGMTVRTVLGLPPSVARVGGMIASLFSFVFTIPWLFEFWRARQKRNNRPFRPVERRIRRAQLPAQGRPAEPS
jgi:hypothetical protein